MRTWVVCAAMACARVALAAPGGDAHAHYQRAEQLDDGGDSERALAIIEEGLALAPRDLALLGLKGAVLLKLRDYAGALAAYAAYLEAGAKGGNRREAQKIVNNLRIVQSTFLAVTLANGPAVIYLDARSQGVFCTAAPSCNRVVLPGGHKLIVERAGFEPWADHVSVDSGKTTRLTVTLVEQRSPLTVRGAPAGARITVDGAAYDASTTLAAGSHQVVVARAGYVDARLEAVAREGLPVALDVALTPRVPIRVAPAGAVVTLDGRPLAVEDGTAAVPPGPHVLVVRAHGFAERRVELPAVRAADYQVAIELARVAEASPMPAPGAFTVRRKLALVAAGVGLAAAAGGVMLGVRSGELADDAYVRCPSPSTPCRDAAAANRLNELARARALDANLAFGVTGGAAIAAAVLWWVGAPESHIAVAPQLGRVAGLDLAVRF